MQNSFKGKNTLWRLKRAFTLYELIIVLAMLVLISGIVISLVVFMNSYSSNMETDSTLVESYVSVREQTDLWFSRMDYAESTISTESKYNDTNGVTTWVSCDDYYIASFEKDGGCIVMFCSEDGVIISVEVPLNCTLNYQLYDDNYQYAQTENVRLQFSVNMPVTGRKYICEVIYAGE